MTLFQEKVWKALQEIPRGKVSTYQDVAKAIGSPQAYRAVGHACNQNPFAPRVPCHRVVASGGKIGGFANGLRAKIKILQQENVRVKNGQIVDFESKHFIFKPTKK